MSSSQGKAGQSISAYLNNFFTFFTLPFEIIFRRKFGERYLSLRGLILSMLPVLMYIHLGKNFYEEVILRAIFYTLKDSFNLRGSVGHYYIDNTIMYQFLSFFVLLGLIHLFFIWLRRNKGEEWHSYSAGVSHLSFLPSLVNHFLFQKVGFFKKIKDKLPNFGFKGYDTQTYFEPLVMLFIGLMLIVVELASSEYNYEYGRRYFNENKTGFLGFYVVVSSVFYFFKEQIRFALAKNTYLDAVDTKIESEHLKDTIVDKKSPKETKGFTVAGVPNLNREKRESIEEIYRRIDPKLKNMI